jgi:hypothetical protein|tara:strand:- start:652 stop:1251 length:600 start_codon:yes stop_codon:yes gene_type:complete
MANTTFSGPIRSEGGFEQVTKSSTTGAFTTNFDVDSSGNITDVGSITADGAIATTSTLKARRPIITTWEASGAVTSALTIAQSGSIVLIHGTLDNVINLPASSGANTGAYFDFLVTTAVGGSKTTTIAIPAATGSAFSAQLSLTGGTAANAVIDVAGDTFTFVASTVVGSTARIVCVSDNGTGQVWMAVGSGSPIATVA